MKSIRIATVISMLLFYCVLSTAHAIDSDSKDLILPPPPPPPPKVERPIDKVLNSPIKPGMIGSERTRPEHPEPVPGIIITHPIK